MIVWGGDVNVNVSSREGAKYNLERNVWTDIPITGAPQSRLDHTATWTGSEMLVFGGQNVDPITEPSTLNDLWSLTPGKLMYLFGKP